MNDDNIISFPPRAIADGESLTNDQRIDEAFGAVKHAMETLRVARQHIKEADPKNQDKHALYRQAAEHLWEALGDMYGAENGSEPLLWCSFIDNVK